MPDYIKNEKGQVVGFTQQQGNTKVYSDAKGNVVSRINDNRTYDKKGNFKGYGDQGLRLYNKD
jgi:YD repeat-containing protein